MDLIYEVNWGDLICEVIWGFCLSLYIDSLDDLKTTGHAPNGSDWQVLSSADGAKWDLPFSLVGQNPVLLMRVNLEQDILELGFHLEV